MVRVLHLVGTLEKAGGAQRLLLEVLTRVDRTRFAPEVAVLHGALELGAELAAIGVPVHDLRGERGLFDPIGVRATRRLVRSRGITVLHCHLSRAEIVGGLAARRLPGVRLLLHKHNDDAWWTRPDLALIHRLIVRRADRIVVVSDAVGDHFARLDNAVRPKLVRVYNGVDLAALDAARGTPGATRLSLGVPADAPLIAAVGRLV
ncbi:MAG TPA: glycosyltransferase, partial [bacterium]|nr:glycosyltransferase [bacterium]